jgi:hypothetical protein
MSQDLTTLPQIEMFVGENRNLGITIRDSNGDPINLTGATVFFMAKRSIDDSDAAAILDQDVTSFASPTSGTASIPINLTSLPADLQAGDATLYADIIVRDSASKITNYGMMQIYLKKGVRQVL